MTVPPVTEIDIRTQAAEAGLRRLDEAFKAVGASGGAFAVELDEQQQAFLRLTAKTDAAARARLQFEAAERRIGAAFDAGKISATQYNAALDQQIAKLQQAAQRQQQFAQTAVAAGGGMRNVGQIAGQAGFQIQDFTVQVAGGQSALTALAQQGSQFLGIFGPAGAIAGAALAIGAVALKFVDWRTEAERAAEATEKLDEAIKAATETVDRQIRLGRELDDQKNRELDRTADLARYYASLDSTVREYERTRLRLRQIDLEERRDAARGSARTVTSDVGRSVSARLRPDDPTFDPYAGMGTTLAARGGEQGARIAEALSDFESGGEIARLYERIFTISTETEGAFTKELRTMLPVLERAALQAHDTERAIKSVTEALDVLNKPLEEQERLALDTSKARATAAREEEAARRAAEKAAADAAREAAREQEAARRATERALADEAKFWAENDKAARDALDAQLKRGRAFEEWLSDLEREAALAGETRDIRADELKIAEARKKAGRDLTDDEERRVRAAVAQKEALESQRKAAEKFAADLERTITRSTDRAVDYAADTIYDGFTGKIKSVGEFLKTTLLRAAAQAMAEMVLRPIIAPIIAAGVQAAVGAGFGSAFGLGGGGLGGGGGGGTSGGGAGTLLGAAGLGYQAGQQGGFWNSILGGGSAASGGTVLAGTAGDALTAFDAAQGAAYGASSLDAVANAGSAAGGASAALAAIAPYLSIAGGLFSAYNFAKNPSVTSGIGAAAGLYGAASAGLGLAGLGALPFAGPIGLAGAAIALIGSLFGGKKKSPVVHSDWTEQMFYLNGGNVSRRIDGQTGYYGITPDRAFGDLPKLVQASLDTVKGLGGTAPDLSLWAAYNSISTPRPELRVFGGPAQGGAQLGTLDLGDMEAAGVGLLKIMLPLADGIDAVYKSVAKNSSARTLKDFAADLDFGKGLADTVAAVGDLKESLAALERQAKTSAVAMAGQFKEIEARADALGIGGTGRDAIAKTIREWLGAQGPQEAPSDVQRMLAQVRGAFAGLGEAGARYGIAPAEIAAANDNALARIRKTFEDRVQDILDPAGAALRDFDKSAAQMRQDARDLGADLVATEKAIAKQRQAVMDQALGGLATNLRAFLDGQAFDATSSLSPTARFAEAQAQYQAALDGAGAGDAYSSQRLVAAAQTLLGQGRSFLGSTEEFAFLESRVRGQLRNFGASQGWEGFAPALQNQTQSLLAGLDTLRDELRQQREQTARLEQRIAQLLTRVA